MVPANIRYTRNWTWARILVRVEGWLVVVSRIYRYNEVSPRSALFATSRDLMG
jgi:hypothetical protein